MGTKVKEGQYCNTMYENLKKKLFEIILNVLGLNSYRLFFCC